MKQTHDAHESKAAAEPVELEAKAEDVSVEDRHLRRSQVLRHVRDEAHLASRQLDVQRLALAVHDLAVLLHELEDAGAPKTT